MFVCAVCVYGKLVYVWVCSCVVCVCLCGVVCSGKAND